MTPSALRGRSPLTDLPLVRLQSDATAQARQKSSPARALSFSLNDSGGHVPRTAYPKSGGIAAAFRDPTVSRATGWMDQMGSHDYYEPVVTSSVYFALDPDACQIKIGYTTRTPEERLDELRRRQRRPNLQLLGSMRGGYKLERAMHARFREHKREAHEWFDSCIAAEVLTLLSDEADL